MREIAALEAKEQLGALLDSVTDGEENLITRDGKAVARLIPAEPRVDRAKALQAAANIKRRSAGVRLNGLRIKDLVTQGRS